MSQRIWLCLAMCMLGCTNDINPASNGWNDTSSNGGSGSPTPDLCQHQVYRHDPLSWIQPTVEMHLDYWGAYWLDITPNNNEAASYFGIWSYLFDHDVLARLSQYGIKGGTLDANYYLNNANLTMPAPDGGVLVSSMAGKTTLLDDNGITTELNNEIQAGQLPPPNDSTLYMIMLPPNTTTNKIVAAKASGYHGSGSWNGSRYTFGIVIYNETVAMDVLISHELYEAITDADLRGWFEDQTGNEIGDLCVGMNSQVGVFNVQKVWDQNACECK